MKPELILVLPAVVSSFVLVPKHSISIRLSQSALASSLDNSNNQNENNNEGLLLNGLDQEMSRMASKYSFTESDYLAAARKRAEMRVESTHAGASDEDWQRIANEKKQQLGEIDDWENSKKEAGNIDSQILMFTEAPADGEDGEEPKLLLF
jgi:hypothetical protein